MSKKILNNISFTVKQDDKIAFLADNENAKTVLFQIIAGELEPDNGELVWGTTITKEYFPKVHLCNIYGVINDEIGEKLEAIAAQIISQMKDN